MDEFIEDIEEISLKIKTATSVDVEILKESFDELTESFNDLKAEADDIEAAKNELVEINDKMDDAIAASVTASQAATTATEAANKAEEAKKEAANSAQQAVTAANLTQQNVLESSQYAYRAQQSAKAAKESETVAAGLADEAKAAANRAKESEENALAAKESISLELAENYARKEEIPEIPKNVSAFINDVGYLTSHQDLSNYVTNADLEDALSTLDLSAKQDVIPDLETIRAGAALGATAIQEHQDLSDYALKTEIPDIANFATVDQLPDVSEFITAADIPDVSNFATKDELADAGKVKTVNGQEPDADGNIELDIETGGNLQFSYENENLTINAKGSVFVPTAEQLENINRDHSNYVTNDVIGNIESILDNLLS